MYDLFVLCDLVSFRALMQKQHFLIGAVELYLTDNNSYQGENTACLAAVRRMLGVLRCLADDASRR